MYSMLNTLVLTLPNKFKFKIFLKYLGLLWQHNKVYSYANENQVILGKHFNPFPLFPICMISFDDLDLLNDWNKSVILMNIRKQTYLWKEVTWSIHHLTTAQRENILIKITDSSALNECGYSALP